MDLLEALRSFVCSKLHPDAVSCLTEPLPDRSTCALRECFRGYTWVEVRSGDKCQLFAIQSVESPWRYGLAQIEEAIFSPQAERHLISGIKPPNMGRYLILEVLDPSHSNYPCAADRFRAMGGAGRTRLKMRS